MPFLSLQDIIFAAMLALAITWIVRKIFIILTAIITRTTELGYKPKELDEVLQRCYSMFPIESFRFNGLIFHRGMLVRVVNSRNMVIEGEFIGISEDNMICFLTPNSVVAQEIDNIEEIKSLG